MSIAEILQKYDLVDLSQLFEDGMPRPQVPYGHIIWKSAQRGDSYNTFMILVFEHAGTHVDAPIHLGGVTGPSIAEVPLHRWMGGCYVLDMKEKQDREYVAMAEIQQWETLHGPIAADAMVLFNYGWSTRWKVPSGVEDQPYLRDFPGLSLEAARYLAKRKVGLVGTDTPSIDSFADLEEHAHQVFLPQHILILENLTNLDQLPPTGAYLMAFPLKIGDGTGSPVRAVGFVPRNTLQSQTNSESSENPL